MVQRSLILVLSGLGVVYLAAPVSAQLFEDPTKFYKNMTFDFDVRHRGQVGLPLCIKQLMECWEVSRPETICSHNLYFESMCGLMRNLRCHDLVPFGKIGWPYDNFHLFEMVCAKDLTGYWTRRRESPPPGGAPSSEAL